MKQTNKQYNTSSSPILLDGEKKTIIKIYR